ncbi:MAG: 23S rRNA (adenine(2503)-C(2))-methyltransferase RlmN [Eubacterium sp.]|jgi:23S rRNA (adenine2503-C2)-methyltransferase
MDKTEIESMTMKELTEYLEAMGEKKFHAKQIYAWMHVRHAGSFDEMTDLSKKLRQKLNDTCTYSRPKLVTMQESRIDGTRKYLFELADGCRVESVLMKYRHGNSVCISSQAGCRMGCTFCASTIGGLIRSLTPAEMLEQVYSIGDDIGARISNVVVMGMGEPLDNFDNLLQFITMLTDEHGLHISQRNLTVSTCGLVPGIRALAKEKFAITLALSLHASSQEKREKLMPIARKYKLEEVMDACDYYFQETGRRITFEYSLIAGVNDTEKDAAELRDLLHGKNCHMNLIPVNPVRETGYRAPDGAAVAAFKNKLEKYGINVTIRREMGRDIDGACGQLRKRLAER